MKHWMLFILIISTSNICFGAIQETVAYLARDANKDKVLKSTNNICHPPGSDFRDSVKIREDEKNVYDTLTDCIESGGSITAESKKMLTTESPYLAAELEAQENLNKQKTQFSGLNWGAGLAFLVYNRSFVEEMTIDSENGVVRVNKEVSNTAVAMLESHFFFTPGKKKIFGIGPFVSIGIVGEDGVDPLSLYGIGLMTGFKRPNSGSSWNIGVGYFIDTETETLRNNLKDGDPTTETDPNKLIVQSDVGGLMLMFSANF